ncbi:MAG TPA: ATP-binding protein, partial [Phenylobacterium sp.]
MALSDREQAELIRTLYRNLPVQVLCLLVGAAVLTAGLSYLAPDRAPQAIAWLAVSAVIAAGELALWAWHRQTRPSDAEWRHWGRLATLAALVDGLRWGFGSIWMPAPGNFDQQQWVCMVVGGAACASVAALGTYMPAFVALLVTAMVPYFFYAAYVGDPRYLGVALLGMILTVAVIALGNRLRGNLGEALRLKFENLDLAESLREQKEVAEEANRAKTQFLAAASHDLRQPMHALGLFVAALSRTRMTPEGERLTGQIAETVDAMGGLFGALLDISQLDAGLVAPQRRAFEIGPLLARLCREQAAELGRRPVTLRRVESRAIIESDPVLLERMLRNLISNAVQHTPKGRVLVGCRRRGGRLSVQVWDTGPGIAPEHQEQVFREYYQLGNPERDRAKGLGLGLAITRRLSVLLDCPVGLRSQVGRGSMFSLDVPRAAAGAREPVEAVPSAGPLQGLVFVIDDELMVQQSMTHLLDAWGYEVVTGGSVEELMARADPARAPDLVICDWRLRGEETALSAIAR